jgi:hypothetical protein
MKAGRSPFGYATGFLYAGPDATRWVVTNWHVVTGRRPDDQGFLIGRKPASPSWLRFKIDDPAGMGCQQIELALYDANGPTWIEWGRERGVDLALVRLSDAPQFLLPLSQTFAPNSTRSLEPGLDVTIVGHPFELGKHSRSSIWKNAIVASDRDDSEGGTPWILLDAPGVPGMSGSPVYRRLSGFDSGFSLELVGVYAGAVGNTALEEMRLGRAFPIGLVEDLLRRQERGNNPFPPIE